MSGPRPKATEGRALFADWDLGPTQLMGGLNSLTPLASEKLVAGACSTTYLLTVPRSHFKRKRLK